MNRLSFALQDVVLGIALITDGIVGLVTVGRVKFRLSVVLGRYFFNKWWDSIPYEEDEEDYEA